MDNLLDSKLKNCDFKPRVGHGCFSELVQLSVSLPVPFGGDT